VKLYASFVVPTFNESANVLRCLNSIEAQTYPHSLIEIIIADAHSTDNTVALIEEWQRTHDIPVTILNNDRKVAEFGKAIALREAKGDLLCLLDCDEELVQPDALEAYVKAFEVFPDVIGVEPHFLKVPGGSIVNNYLAVTHYTDPMGETIARKPWVVESQVVDGKTYRKMQIPPGYGCMLFLRREYVEPYLQGEQFHEGTILPDLVLKGHNNMCMIDGYGVYHHHIKSLGEFVRKRMKIGSKFMTRRKTTKNWVDYTGKSMEVAALLNLLVLPQLCRSVWKAIKHREILWLLHAPMCFLSTVTYILLFIQIKLTRKKAW
jgi:glycosyltransferase involved in cell wall biosynthesis